MEALKIDDASRAAPQPGTTIVSEISNERLAEMLAEVIDLEPGRVRMSDSDVVDLRSALIELQSRRSAPESEALEDEAETWCRLAGKAIDALDTISGWEVEADDEDAAGKMADLATQSAAEIRAAYPVPALSYANRSGEQYGPEAVELAMIAETGEVFVSEDSPLKEKLDALPEVPFGGLKTVSVVALSDHTAAIEGLHQIIRNLVLFINTNAKHLPEAKKNAIWDYMKRKGVQGSVLRSVPMPLAAVRPEAGWPIDTEDQVETLARECGWNNRRYMTSDDYSIWCAQMRKFARLAGNTVEAERDAFLRICETIGVTPSAGAWLDAKGKLDHLTQKLATARNALEPFDLGLNWVDDHGWTDHAPRNDRICDWFGPSAFLSVQNAIASIKELD